MRPLGLRQIARYAIPPLALLVSAAHARADVRITLSFVNYEHEIYPREAEHRAAFVREFVLTKDGRVKTSLSGTRRHGKDIETSLGGTVEGGSAKSGTEHVETFTVDNGDFVMTSNFPSYRMVMRIKTNQVDTCEATREFKLNQGYAYYVMHRRGSREEMRVSEIRTENMSCKIEAVAK
jgi:hypothetical protein